jgi:hypothetical protein
MVRNIGAIAGGFFEMYRRQNNLARFAAVWPSGGDPERHFGKLARRFVSAKTPPHFHR